MHGPMNVKFTMILVETVFSVRRPYRAQTQYVLTVQYSECS